MAEPPKKKTEAVALSYSPEDNAPKIVAAGVGVAAESIIRVAEEHGIPLHVDPELAHTLNTLKIGSEIPPELYTVVAKILAYVSDVDKLMER